MNKRRLSKKSLSKKSKLSLFLAGAVWLLPNTLFAGVGEGGELYDAYCTVCHGGLGEGQAMGKALTDNTANRLSDTDLLAVITDGRAGTGMAAWGGSFSEEEIYDIATFVRTLQGKPGLSIGNEDSGPSDDPMVIAGEALFNNQGNCVSCHSYDDNGGSIGPSLDGVGSRLSDSALLDALSNPSASLVSGYGAKIVTQNDGSTVRGRFRNDSELAVQIQSEDGKRWVTYFKDRVASITDDEQSLMPDVYSTLGDEEQQQILAFIKSL
ncbi:MAG: c-type cytochrome [Pseudohongiellaceae bacterium]